MTTPIIVVHGGAGRVARHHVDAAVAGVRRAAEIGQALLLGGASAEEACVAAVRSLEDDPTFNAGRGACMNADGRFELDACIMRSKDMRSGAVAAVPEIADPILLARAVMEHSRHRVLAGEGAARFGRELGIGTYGHEALWTAKAQQRYDEAKAGTSSIDGQADTVGAVVLDGRGDLCVGCSTGGVLLKTPGRVGDTPLCGGGFYAHPQWGAACATGLGEAILSRVASYEVLRRIADRTDPDVAAAAVCQEVGSVEAESTCGIILLTPDGRVGIAHHSPDMSWAVATGADAVRAGIRR